MQKNKTALITGATGGLGIQLCREFAHHGYNLVITARDPARLRSLAARLRVVYGVAVTSIVADLNQEESARRLYQKTRALDIQVDVLVNNAGFGLGGPFAENAARLQDAMIRVNALAPTRLCRRYLPGMLERAEGGILNICSTGSFVAGPNNAVYCATKAYLLSLTEALAEETRGTGVRAIAVCPGATRTGFASRAEMESTLLFNYGVMSAREVARFAYRAYAAGCKPVSIPGALNRVSMAATRFVPRSVSTYLSGLMQKRYTVKK